MSRARDVSTMPVHEAAREMVRRFGARAAKVARDREDDAKSAVTARFYAQVGEAIGQQAEERDLAARGVAVARREPTTDDFLRECISRALATLPWATLQDEDSRQPGYGDLFAMRALVERGGAKAAQVRAVSDVFRSEVLIHQSAGNFIKADVIEKFRKQLVDSCHLWSSS